MNHPVSLIINHSAIAAGAGQGHLAQMIAIVVLITGGVGYPEFGFNHLGLVTKAIVFKVITAALVGSDAQVT